MFHHPAWAVASYSSGQPAAGTVGIKSTGGFHHPDGSPCKTITWSLGGLNLELGHVLHNISIGPKKAKQYEQATRERALLKELLSGYIGGRNSLGVWSHP